MKNLRPIYVLLTLVLMISGGCEKNNPGTNNDAETVSNTLTAGTWRVSYLWESGHNDTDDFSGYTFVFLSGGNVIATKGSSSDTGTWVAVDIKDHNNCNLTIDFPSQNFMAKLSHDWHVIERTTIKVRMVDESGSSGPEYLTFEQN